MIYVAFFEASDMFAKFSRVSEVGVSEWGDVVSVSRLEVVLSKSNVCFGGVIVAPGDGGLVGDRQL